MEDNICDAISVLSRYYFDAIHAEVKDSASIQQLINKILNG